jgi:hypothetical protein
MTIYAVIDRRSGNVCKLFEGQQDAYDYIAEYPSVDWLQVCPMPVELDSRKPVFVR